MCQASPVIWSKLQSPCKGPEGSMQCYRPPPPRLHQSARTSNLSFLYSPLQHTSHMPAWNVLPLRSAWPASTLSSSLQSAFSSLTIVCTSAILSPAPTPHTLSSSTLHFSPLSVPPCDILCTLVICLIYVLCLQDGWFHDLCTEASACFGHCYICREEPLTQKKCLINIYYIHEVLERKFVSESRR